VPTIRDVANLAKVSVASVSLVINDPATSRVGALKRKEILRVAQQIGYRPNGFAKALLKKQTRILGLVVPLRDPIFLNQFLAEVLSGIQYCMMSRGYHLMIYSNHESSGRIGIDEIRESRFTDGLIVVNTRMCSDADIDETITGLRRGGFPFVMVNSYYGREPINYVGVDDHVIGRMAGEYLVKKGHRRITFLGGSKQSSHSLILVGGLRAALREKGLTLKAPDICYTDYDRDILGECVREWLRAPQRPTAIFCADDQLVPGVYGALRESGLAIPTDMAVLGRGDLSFTSYLEPKLSSLSIPTFHMGKKAAELLIDLVENPGAPPTRILMPSQLIERESA
jgi:LacI family transcriptional regulator